MIHIGHPINIDENLSRSLNELKDYVEGEPDDIKGISVQYSPNIAHQKLRCIITIVKMLEAYHMSTIFTTLIFRTRDY